MRRTTGLGWWLDHQESTFADARDNGRGRETLYLVPIAEFPNLYDGSRSPFIPSDPHPPVQQHWVAA